MSSILQRLLKVRPVDIAATAIDYRSLEPGAPAAAGGLIGGGPRDLLGRAHAGAIVDLHDAEGTPAAPARLMEALPALLEGLRGRGWQLTTVVDLLSARG